MPFLKYMMPEKLRTFLQFQRGILIRYGWLRSWWKGKPIDGKGEPLPWITYPASDFISQFDFTDATVFEWGSGFSTLWWAKRAKAITTVEGNPSWIPYIKTLLPAKVEFIEVPFKVESELQAIQDHPRKLHDVIVIDNHGPFRWRCAELASTHLSSGGMIILDNSDQCHKACAVLREAGFVEIDFAGFAPSVQYAQTTSIFFRDRLKFPAHLPVRSPAQANPPWENC